MILLFVLISGCSQENVIINELMAWNESTIPQGEFFFDWIELYNLSSETISLEGYYLTNEPEDPFRHKLSGSLSIGGGGHLLLWASDETTDDLHLGFKLSKSGDSITLYRYNGELTLVDTYSYVNMGEDISHARIPDGGDWDSTTNPTPGASNQ